MNDLTRLLNSIQLGDTTASGELQRLVYEELHKLAAQKMACESPGQTLQATSLVHEAWLRRRKKAARHGGHLERVTASAMDIAADADDRLLVIHEALERLAAHDALKAELVKLRYFVGLTIDQAAQVLGISEATAKRHWAYARAWLYREIEHI